MNNYGKKDTHWCYLEFVIISHQVSSGDQVTNILSNEIIRLIGLFQSLKKRDTKKKFRNCSVSMNYSLKDAPFWAKLRVHTLFCTFYWLKTPLYIFEWYKTLQFCHSLRMNMKHFKVNLFHDHFLHY